LDHLLEPIRLHLLQKVQFRIQRGFPLLKDRDIELASNR
jgi:hypothetical protein